MKGIRFTLGFAVASSQREKRERDGVLVQNIEGLHYKIPRFLSLRKDSLAAAIITHRNKDRLTRKKKKKIEPRILDLTSMDVE